MPRTSALVTPSDVQRVPNGDRKALIVEAAVELFAALPYEDISVDDICERAGVAHGLVSYHFKGKRGLLYAAVQAIWQEMSDYQSPQAKERTVDQRLRGFMVRHFDYIRANRAKFVLIVNSSHAYPEHVELLAASQSKGAALIREILGLDDAGDIYVRATLRGWVGYIHAITLDWLDNGDLEPRDLARLCLDSLWSSLSAPRRVLEVADD